MASIVFRPTCSKCKKILESEVINVEEAAELYASNKLYETLRYSISPAICPYCKEIFNNVVSPGRICFPVSDDSIMAHASSR